MLDVFGSSTPLPPSPAFALLLFLYSVFHQFRQAKFALWRFDFKHEPIIATDLEAFKNDDHFKSD
jgi:hypothetical protein